MDAHFQRISELFERARQITDAAQREAFLDAECGDLRGEIETLLAAHDEESARRDSVILPGLGEAVSDAWKATQAEPAPPELVEGFRIVERIGSGGMGTVYAADQEEPRRRVALKVLRPEADRGRFRREVLALARLQHPGIAQILSSGECTTPVGRSPYLAMELIDGVRVDEYARSLDERGKIELVTRLCDAVAHAHRRGIVHRDLKPTNILVQHDGQPKVLDFGLAMATDDSDGEFARQTKTGHLVGTLAYMSPEQAAGSRDGIDTRSDVYALGVLAHEMLVGRLPHSLEDMPLRDALRTLVDEEPEDSGTLRGDLRVILRKALAKDPEMRYDGAQAFADDLRRYLNDEPILARPPSAMYQIRKFVRRHRAPVAGAAATILALIVGLVLAVRAAGREAKERQRADSEREIARAAAAHAFLQAAAADVRTHQYPSARANLAQVRAGFRDWEWEYLSARVDRSLEFQPLPDGVTHADVLRSRAVLPQSRILVGHDCRVEYDGESKTARLFGPGKKALFTGIQREVLRVRIALGGRRVVLLGRGSGHRSQRLSICDSAGGAPLFELPAQVGAESNIALDPTGTRLLHAGFGGRVQLFDVEAGKRLHSQHTHSGSAVDAVALGPRDLAATGGNDRAIQIMDATTGRILRRWPAHSAPLRALAFTPDGNTLVSGALDGTIRVWDPQTGALRNVLPVESLGVYALGFEADGRDLWALCGDGVRRWRLDEDAITTLRVHQSFVYAVDFAPDGRTLATAGWKGRAYVIDAARGRIIREIGSRFHPRHRFAADGVLWSKDTRRAPPDWTRQPHPGTSGGAHAIAVSRDGTRIASGAGAKASARVFRASDGEDIGRWTGLKGVVHALALSSDGTVVATGASRHLQVRSVDTGEILVEEQLPGGIESLDFHPSRPLLAIGGYDRFIRIWDVRKDRLHRQLTGHYGTVWTLRFHPSGTRLFSGSDDATIRVWDPETGLEKLRLEGHDSYVFDLSFTPDGKTLASGSGDFTVKIWSTRSMRARWRDAE